MNERVFQFVAAATDKFFRRVQREFVARLDAIAGFVRGLAVDADGPGEDESLGAFAAGAEGAFDEGLIHTGHGRKLPENRLADKNRREKVNAQAWRGGASRTKAVATTRPKPGVSMAGGEQKGLHEEDQSRDSQTEADKPELRTFGQD